MKTRVIMRKCFAINIIMSVLMILVAPINAMASTENSLIEIAKSDYEILEKALDAYFALRENSFVVEDITMAKDLEVATYAESTVITDELERRELLLNVEKNMGIRVLEAEIETTVYYATKIEQPQNLNNVITYSEITNEMEYYHVSVYEWTWINYDYEKEGTEDVMGYATTHDIILEKAGDTAVVVSDAYEDPFYTGMESTDYGVEYTDIITGDRIYELDVASITGEANYNVNNAIEYADTHVIHGYLYDGSDNSYYNDEYSDYSYNKVDCCNFVSQCLAAGGLEETEGWHSKKWGTDRTNTTSWTSISNLTKYLSAEGYTIVSANGSTIFPGNPVYYSKHIGLCVGYNTAGVPILNAHTSDAYHIPYTHWNNYDLYTVLISTENLQKNVPSDAINLGIVSTSKGYEGNISGQEADYYCFTPAKTGFYDIYTTGSIDTVGYLCKNEVKNTDVVGDDEKEIALFMYEISKDDDGGDNGNFSMYEYLVAGELYYVKVISYGGSETGSYTFYVEWATN